MWQRWSEKSTAVVSLCLLLCIAGGVYYSYYSPSGFFARERSDVRRITDGDTAHYTTLSGDVFDMRSYEGKILVVNAWASWSPFSKSEFELLSALKSEYGNEITILAVNRMESTELANAYLDSIGRTEGIEFIIDPTDHFFDTVEGYAMPETIVYDKYGHITYHMRGTIVPGEIKSALNALTYEEE